MYRTDKYSEHSAIIWPVWLNSWVLVYESNGSGFESSCSHLNLKFHACFEQGVPWHSGNYRVWIHSENAYVTWQSAIGRHWVVCVKSDFNFFCCCFAWIFETNQRYLFTPNPKPLTFERKLLQCSKFFLLCYPYLINHLFFIFLVCESLRGLDYVFFYLFLFFSLGHQWSGLSNMTF